MSVTLSFLLVVVSLAETPQADTEAPPMPGSPSKVHVVSGPQKPSVAEQVSHLQRDMDADQKALKHLKSQLDDPDGDFNKSQSLFRTLDAKLDKQKKALEHARDNMDQAVIEKLEASLADLGQEWQLAKDRFNLAIQERKTLQEKITVLGEKQQQDQKLLDQLTGKTAPPADTKDQAQAAPDPKTKTPAPADPNPTTAKSGTTASPDKAAAVAGAPSLPMLSDLVKKKELKESKELVEAKKTVTLKEEEVKKAQEKFTSVSQRMDFLRKNIAVEQSLLEMARQKLDNIQKMIGVLEEEERKNLEKGVSLNKMQEAWKKLSDERQGAEKVRLEVRTITNRLTKLQGDLSDLQNEKIQALEEVNRMNGEAEDARQKVADLQNPFNPENIGRWLLDRGPPIGVVLACMVLVLQLVRLFSKRTVGVLIRSSKRKNREREAEQRIDTLAGVLRNFTAVAVWIGGMLMILDLMSIPVIPLMGGAAVFGLAVAFGAQNMIRDYFTGFMILVEDQYGVKDIVKIGDTAGQVERISLRMTVLRDQEGNVHFIPHGTITQVTNLSHSWSRAVLEVGVAYKENVDRVFQIIKGLGKELRADPDFAPVITEDLEMLGVDSLSDSAVVLKFAIKTRPQKQWMVKREMLRRVKNRFDELGIEMPFPHRTVYHRMLPGEPVPDAQAREAA